MLPVTSVRIALVAVAVIVSMTFLFQPTNPEEPLVSQAVSDVSGVETGAGWIIPSPLAFPAPTPEPTLTPVVVEVTPAPTPKPSPPPKPAAIPANAVAQQIYELWPEAATKSKAVCLARLESGFNPHAKSRSGKYWGLFQADADFRATYGWAGWGVAEQVAMAWRGYQARGWQPWPPARRC